MKAEDRCYKGKMPKQVWGQMDDLRPISLTSNDLNFKHFGTCITLKPHFPKGYLFVGYILKQDWGQMANLRLTLNDR